MHDKGYEATANGAAASRGFTAKGYAVFRHLLCADEVGYYRQRLDELHGDPRQPATCRKCSDAYAFVDGVTQCEAFWPLIFHERVLAAVRGILGPDICYVRHTDLHVNYPRQPLWHRDIEEPIERIDRRVRFTPALFGVMRVGVYLHDRMVFGVLRGSHLTHRRRTDRVVGWTNTANRLLMSMRAHHAALILPPLGRVDWLELDSGDAVAFDIRIVHSGHYALGPKYAVYLCYGLRNAHTAEHQERFVAKPEIGGAPMPAQLQDQLFRSALHLTRSPEEKPAQAAGA